MSANTNYQITVKHVYGESDKVSQDSSVGIATCYRLDGPGVESQWPSGLRRGSAADRLLGIRVRIPLGAWMFVLCVLYSKDKRQIQDNQDKEVEIKYKKMPVEDRFSAPVGSPILLYNGYRVSFPGVKRPGRGVNLPSPTRAEVKEKVELYLHYHSGLSWPALERILPLLFRKLSEYDDKARTNNIQSNNAVTLTCRRDSVAPQIGLTTYVSKTEGKGAINQKKLK